MTGMGDREAYGIGDDKFLLILTSSITGILTNDSMLNLLVDSEVCHRLGVEEWEEDDPRVGTVRAAVITEGLQSVIQTIQTLTAAGFDIERAMELDQEARNPQVPDDLSGLDWA